MSRDDDDDAGESLDRTLHKIPQLLKRRQKDLERKEEELRKARKDFALEMGESFGSSKPSDVIRLNVGGERCDVLRRTLCQVDGSMLASRFSGRWDDSLEKDSDGNFFIDQPYELFKILLDLLRAHAIATPNAPPVQLPYIPSEQVKDFVRMVEYYGCTPGIYRTKLEVVRGEPETVKLASYPGLSVNSSSWSTIALRRDGHSRAILAYTIELGDVERALIGWASDTFRSHLTAGNWPGVGEEEKSIVLDCCSSALLSQGRSSQTTTLNIGQGSTVRCELLEKRWLVDGEVIEAASDDCWKHRNLTPVFSGKGQWRITDVVLGYK